MRKLGLLVMPLMAISLLVSCGGGGNPEPVKKWYEYEKWWDYCSSGIKDEEATKSDIGKEVNVTVYDKVHKVRLIDVDHINAEGENPEAHCTFEFANLITDSNGAVTTKWNTKEPHVNYNFPDSTLNDFLNKNDDCIFNKLPTELQGVIKEVNKKVGFGESYTATAYLTRLFPLAHDEMGDHSDKTPIGEGIKYQYYIDHPSKEDRVKKVVDGTDGELYWLRSPAIDGIYYVDVYSCNSKGEFTLGYTTYISAHAVAPAFCI